MVHPTEEICYAAIFYRSPKCILIDYSRGIQVDNLLKTELVLEKGASAWVHGWVHDLCEWDVEGLGDFEE
jgi:hypothetical protein